MKGERPGALHANAGTVKPLLLHQQLAACSLGLLGVLAC